MTTVVGLLRAVNVGGRKVVMAELREALAAAGFADPRTYLASGNVLVGTELPPAAAGTAMEAAIAERFGFAVPVLVRTAEELAAVAATDPFDGEASDPARRLVAFFPAPPDVGPLAGVDVAPERFAAVGRELHLWCPGGVGRSAMLNGRPMARVWGAATARNWNTVTKLTELVTMHR